MLASLLVVFREALEAGLIIGIILAATQGVPARLRWIAAGALAGLAGAGMLAVCAGALSDLFDGTGQEIFTAAVLCIAVLMLGWHVTWMAAHARGLSAQMRAVGQDVRLGKRSLVALAVVVGLAVVREGAEIVLFIYGIAMSGQQSAAGLLAGGVCGLALAVAASYALYRGLTVLPLHRLFSVTNGLIVLLAAGMAGQAASILHSADLLPGWGERIWSTAWLIPDGGIAGRALHALVGYAAQPCGVQLAAWGVTLLVLATASRLAARPRRRAGTAAATLIAGGAACILCVAPAHAADLPVLVFKQHRFYPDHITVPAGQKIRLVVQNTDDTADEFESVDLNREKLVAPGGKITVFLGPLDAGSYKFFGCFHRDTAQGVIDAK